MSGTKVTSDATTTEGAGTITSDSLAGESIASHGAFATKNPGVGASAQPSASTNTNNTDTSNATTLAPAPDAEARQASEEWSESQILNAGKGLGQSSGTSAGAEEVAVSLPKGDNIKEGGFDGSAPNASFNGDVGGKNDPAREALRGFQKASAKVGGDVGENDTELSKDGQFEALGGDTSA